MTATAVAVHRVLRPGLSSPLACCCVHADSFELCDKAHDERCYDSIFLGASYAWQVSHNFELHRARWDDTVEHTNQRDVAWS